MPALIALVPWILTGVTGAFLGAQVNNMTTPAQDSQSQVPSINKIMLYSAGALALYWGAKKTGLVK